MKLITIKGMASNRIVPVFVKKLMYLLALLFSLRLLSQMNNGRLISDKISKYATNHRCAQPGIGVRPGIRL